MPPETAPPAVAEPAEDLLGPYGTWPFIERRSGADRRAKPTRFLSRFIFGGQRAGGRRKGEQQNVYVDRYDRQDLTLAGGVLILNILDAIFTLLFVMKQGAGREVNPLAQFLIDADPENYFWFLFSKSIVVLLCVLFLVMHKTFKLVRPALFLLFGFYAILFGYHLLLQIQLL